MNNEEQCGVEKPVALVALPGQEKLKGSWQLLKEACGEYRARFATYLAFFSVPIILAILLSGLSYATMFPPFAYMPLLSGVKIVLSILSLFAGILAGFALLLSVREGYGAKEALVQAMRNSLPYMFVSFLVCSGLIGGSFLFLVPGLLFLAWFSFSFFAFVFEGKRGMDALLRSKQLVSGSFWKVAGRMFFLAILLLMLTVPLAILGRYVGHWGNLVLEVFTLLLTPVMLLYSLFLFRDLVRIQGSATSAVSKTSFKTLVWFSVLLGTPFIVGMIAFRSMLLVTHDIPEPDDSDLQLPILNIPREQNAYYVFSEAKDMELGSSEVSTFLDGSEWDDERVQDILQKNQNVLDIFERGVRFSVFQQPEFQNPDRYDVNLESEPIAYLRPLAYVSLLKAQNDFRQGRASDAVDQVLKTLKMGQMIEDAQGAITGYLIGGGIKRQSLETIRSFVGSINFASVNLVQLVQELDIYKDDGKALQQLFKVDYISSARNIERFVSPLFLEKGVVVEKGLEHLVFFSKIGNFYYQPNATKLQNIQDYREGLENMKIKSYSELKQPERKRIRDYVFLGGYDPKIFLIKNAAGEMALMDNRMLEGSLLKKKFESLFLLKATQTFLALKAFEQDRGVLPNSLEELVPLYLSEVPRDPFDGKPMRFSKIRNSLSEASSLEFWEEKREEAQKQVDLFNEELTKQADETLERALRGEDFAELAREISTDTDSSMKGGDLGFSKKGRFVREFENVAFDSSFKKGSIWPYLVESPYGLHILKKIDERGEDDNKEMRISHILLSEKTLEELPLRDRFKPTGLNGTFLNDVFVDYGGERGVKLPQVSIRFNEGGTRFFADLTRRNIGKEIAILVNGEIMSMPKVQAEISDGRAVIVGDFTSEEAEKLAERLDPENAVLYSVGEDLIDDGGDIDEENWQGGKDIGFRVK